MKRATLAKNPDDVSSMFDEVSSKYDITNAALTGGMVYVWRHATRDAINPQPGMRILDIAAGTGTSAASYAACGAQVVASDFSEGMMREGRRRYPDMEFVRADAMDLPFADNSFDVTTISYGLRNIHDPLVALAQMLRVTKPGGRVVITEFSRPTCPVFRGLYEFYLGAIMPRIASVVSSDQAAYHYLVESIMDWPAQQELGQMIASVGWQDVEYCNLTNGIVAIHRARKPLAEKAA
ncbi:class I SAM-dependent methyltransferase [Trueperella sp. LYQ143]|uniref:class I SAM-dependent methyltransferase n=1 Tax=unclassified Trueperella TaxID=2630174 RepID=UPI0039839E6A